jgi:hypothetical protein
MQEPVNCEDYAILKMLLSRSPKSCISGPIDGFDGNFVIDAE